MSLLEKLHRIDRALGFIEAQGEFTIEELATRLETTTIASKKLLKSMSRDGLAHVSPNVTNRRYRGWVTGKGTKFREWYLFAVTHSLLSVTL